MSNSDNLTAAMSGSSQNGTAQSHAKRYRAPFCVHPGEVLDGTISDHCDVRRRTSNPGPKGGTDRRTSVTMITVGRPDVQPPADQAWAPGSRARTRRSVPRTTSAETGRWVRREPFCAVPFYLRIAREAYDIFHTLELPAVYDDSRASLATSRAEASFAKARRQCVLRRRYSLL